MTYMQMWNKTLSIDRWQHKITLNQRMLQTCGNDNNKRNQIHHTSYQKLKKN